MKWKWLDSGPYVAAACLLLSPFVGQASAALTDPWTMWEFVRNYSGPDKIARLHNSFAVGSRGGCSGTMISPHLFLSAAHCGGGLIDVRFFHIDEDAPGPAPQYQQLSPPYRGRALPWQQFIHATGTQEGDAQLFWVEDDSDGVPPGLRYGYVELSTSPLAANSEAYSFWVNPEDSLNTTILYSDGAIHTLGQQPIGDPPLFFSKSDLYARPGASGSSILRASDQRIIGVTAIAGGNSRTTADSRHLLDSFDSDGNQVLDIVEYDLMLTGARRDSRVPGAQPNFQQLRFDTPLQRAQWRPTDISGSVGHGLNSGEIGGSTIGPAAYRATWNSPWMPQSPGTWVPTLRLETFEDGQFNQPGVTATAGSVLGPGPLTDSVDQDDNNLDDFSGKGGHSFFSANGAAGITFTFDSAVLGGYPKRAGVVWTDGEGEITFEAFDAAGTLLARVGPIALSDGRSDGGTREDRLFAIAHQGGVRSIKISNSQGSIEVDHLHYAMDPLFYWDPALPRDALWHANARFAPNATYRVTAKVSGLPAGSRTGYLKFRSDRGNTEEILPLNPMPGGPSRVVGRVTLGNFDDYRLLVGGSGEESFLLSEVDLLRETTDYSGALNFDMAEERRVWEYVAGSHPTSWGINGAGNFSGVVVGPSPARPNNSAEPGWSIRNLHVGLAQGRWYEITFAAVHVSGRIDADVYAGVEDPAGIVEKRLNWRFAAAGAGTWQTMLVFTNHYLDGLSFGAQDATTYMVDFIRIVELGSEACTPSVTATSNHVGKVGTLAAHAYDSNLGTFFDSSYDNWQYIQLDFSCAIEVAAARRYMTRDGVDTSGNRKEQSEGFSYSWDGAHWETVGPVTSNGWQIYEESRFSSWARINYGWSAWLSFTPKIVARHLRFNWDDDGDRVNEIQIRQ